MKFFILFNFQGQFTEGEKNALLALIESGELDPNDIDASDIPDAAVEDDDDVLDSFGNFLILFFQNKMSGFFRIRLDNFDFSSITGRATQPLLNAFNFNGIRNSGQNLIDAQFGLLNAVGQPFLNVGNRFFDATSRATNQLFGIVSNIKL